MTKQSHSLFADRAPDRPIPMPDDPLRYDRVAAELMLTKRRFEATFVHAPVGIAHVSLDGVFVLVNPRFGEISGYEGDTLVGKDFRKITHPDDLHADETLLARLTAGEFPRYKLEKRYIRSDGSIIWIDLTVALVRDDADQPLFYVAVIEDLSELRAARIEAVHDPLTGLLNRRGFACRALDMQADAARVGGSLSLLFLDLDGFKEVNDAKGHAAGDLCLVEVARLMQSRAGPGDIMARMGGDEFLMLTSHADSDHAPAVADAIRRSLADSALGVSASFGLVTIAAAEVQDIDALIARADCAMLAAKRAGKDRVVRG